MTAPPPTPIGSSVSASPCGPPDVAVDVSGEGATGSILLIIDVTNRGAAPCSLLGAPSSIGLRAGDGDLPVTYQARSDPWPGTAPDTVARPIELPPGWKARARAIWSNWCGDRADVSTVAVGLTGGAVDARPVVEIQPPRCDIQGAESTVQAFPFEEDTSGG